MNLLEGLSKGHARSALILGHTTSGMGEKVLAHKIGTLLKEAGFEALPTIDLIELMGDNYERYARLNYDLADGGYSLIEGIEPLSLPSADIALILSWCYSLAALFATDFCRARRVIAKLFAHHPNERILPKLYEPADLLITESLLANERGIAYGIDPSKMLYLPHCYPNYPIRKIYPNDLKNWNLGCAKAPGLNDRKSVNIANIDQLAIVQSRELSRQAKSNFSSHLGINGGKKRVIGTVARLEYGKNCEFAVEAVRRLAQKGHDVLLYLKGDFPENSPYPGYKSLMTEMLKVYKDEEWLVWDTTSSPFPEILETIAQFDLLLHPSGAEGGSHVVVEALGLGIPCVVLNCSTNPFLFKGLATFVNTTGKIRHAQLPFYIPDLNDLVDKLECELPPPNSARVSERFHSDVARERIPLLFDPDPEKIIALYEEDRKLYGIG